MTDPTEPQKDYWTPQERHARTARRKARQQEAEAFAELFVKHGKVPPAARAMWPDLHPDKARDKARALIRTRTYLEVFDRVSRRMQAQLEISPQWCLRLWKELALNSGSDEIKLRATELIAKHLGMFTHRQEVRSMKVDLSGFSNERLLELARTRLTVLDTRAQPSSEP